MIADVVSAVGPRGIRKSRLTIVGIATIALLVVLGIGGLQGGWALMNPEPDGSALGMSVELLQ